jgi:hypothetical protein
MKIKLVHILKNQKKVSKNELILFKIQNEKIRAREGVFAALSAGAQPLQMKQKKGEEKLALEIMVGEKINILVL